MSVLVVSGTGTGVGKTVVTASHIGELNRSPASAKTQWTGEGLVAPGSDLVAGPVTRRSE